MLSNNKTKKQNSPSPNNVRNLIGISTVINGEIISEGDFRIDGKLEGKIETAGKIVIGNKGTVTGDIHCKNADIEGKVTGSIHCKGMLTLRSSAVIEGEVFIDKLEIEPGAVFNASCNMKGIKNLNHETGETSKASQNAS